MGLPRWWRILWGDTPITRAEYIGAGVALATLKYVVDAALIGWRLGRLWTPADYLRLLLGPQLLPQFEISLLLLLWAIPFVWFGIDLSRRRAIDAARPGWWALGFAVPYLNYVTIVALALHPTRRISADGPDVVARRRWADVMGIAAGAIAGVLVVHLHIVLGRSYPASLFVTVPFLIGAFIGWWLNADERQGVAYTVGWGASALVPGALLLMAMGMEGLLCVVMALPLALPPVVLGAAAGRRLAGDRHTGRSTLAMLAFTPLIGLVEAPAPSGPREVVSSVVIHAPTDVVWRHVVAFPPITAPAHGVFRLGIAMPLSAEIDGRGVGAIRRCRFTTGDFVEPITAWEPGRRLAFDVTTQPLPLREWTWTSAAPPHLEVGFRTIRGEFRLVPLADGTTRLEGRTWYALTLQPAAYWAVWSDAILHRVHDRVLQHIATVSETEGKTPPVRAVVGVDSRHQLP